MLPSGTAILDLPTNEEVLNVFPEILPDPRIIDVNELCCCCIGNWKANAVVSCICYRKFKQW